MTTFTNAFTTAFAARATALSLAALSLAALVSLAVLGGLGHIADRQVGDQVMAQAATAATQVVVVTGQRLPKA